MAQQKVRIGIVGAGANTRSRHIPGFRAIDDVEIIGVVNSSPKSTDRVAAEFEIPRTYFDWQSLIADPDLDAVMIGTWPNLHCEVTLAALEAGKHVLTEARMAGNAAEAHQMLQAAQANPEFVTQIVPSPFGLIFHDYVREMIETGYLGELRELVVIGADDMFWDYSRELHWRQDAEISGFNVLMLGILHESAMRWCPPSTRVFAQTSVFEPQRPSPREAGNVDVTVPDSVQVVTQLEGGARGLYHFSGVELFGPGQQIHLYGSSGTIKLMIAAGAEDKLLIGRAGDPELQELQIPEEKRGGWRVEAEFIGAIRGEETVRLTDFDTGVCYMEFTEAIARSASTNLPVDLPLSDVT